MVYLDFVVLIVPAAIAFAACFAWGLKPGFAIGWALALVIVYVMLLVQITMPEPGSGVQYNRFAGAFGLMQFETYRWATAYLVGALFGWLLFRARRPA